MSVSTGNQFIGGALELATLIDVTDAVAFLIRKDTNSGDVFKINSTDHSGGGTQMTMMVRANGSNDVIPTANVRCIDQKITLGGVGTNTAGSRAANIIMTARNGMSASGVDGFALRGISSGFNWASTGTCTEGDGQNTTALVGGGNTVAAGAVTDLVGNRIRVGFQNSIGAGDGDKPITGSVTHATGFNVLAPNDVSVGGSHSITNFYGYKMDDISSIADITNRYARYTVGGDDLHNGGIARKAVATAIDYVVQRYDYLIRVTNTAAPRLITLPSPATLNVVAGTVKYFRIKDESGGAAANNITITPAAGTIDGGASVPIAVNYGYLGCYTDGANYFTVK